jgi:hypothetical protein
MTMTADFPSSLIRPARGTLRAALNALLRPGIGFERPDDVLKDPGLSEEDKRAVLASWASDGCAIPGRPGWRRMLGSETEVPLGEVLDALARLDRRALRPARFNTFPRVKL